MSSTQRILSALPPTFHPDPQPRPWLLAGVVDAVGRWLLESENLLVAVMRAHWVDFADHGAVRIRDLEKLAALFALAPRDDEDVETFRTHLKSYVRTFLEGSATVRGVLRLAASTLALSIEDELDSTPDGPPFLVEIFHPGDDAALKLFGFRAAEIRGVPPGPARLVGVRDLSAGVDLSAARILQLAVDRDNIATVDVAGEDPAATTLFEIARRVNAALGIPAASHDGRALLLTSGLTGSDGEIEIGSPDGDAADGVLGTAPQIYTGAAARAAEVRGRVDHAPAGGLAFLDLRQSRYLRVAVDGSTPVEVDCAGPDPAATTLDEVRDRINTAVGAPVASHDGHFLAITSPTQGAGSRLELPPAPAQDARALLFGPAVRRTPRGADASPGRLLGRADLRAGIELPARATLRLRIDSDEARDVALTGEEPAARALPDIVARVNAVFGAPVASHDGRRLIVTSPTVGAESRIDVLPPAPPATDATELVLGIVPRRYAGTLPDRARLEARITLEDPLDLRRQRRLWLSVDTGPMRAIDCAGPDPARTSLQHVVDRLNQAVGTTVAFHEEGRLVLQSPTAGEQSAIVLRAPETTRRRYFYTRGRVREDAAKALFGFAGGRVEGRLPEPARLVGQVDLSRGADLRIAHTLRIQLDDGDPREIRVANPARPLVTLLPHVVEAINGAFDARVASARDGKLVLISRAEGPPGRVAIGTSTASDAGTLLFGLPPGTAARGREAERVTFVGMADLARGLDVSATHRLRVGIDERPVVDIHLREALAPGAPPVLAPAQIVAALNRALGGSYASHDGRRITLTSQRTGSASTLRIELGADHDATLQVFGLDAPRSYVGLEATAAELIGSVDLSAGIDLSARRHLTLEIDGQKIGDIDCATTDRDPTSLVDIIGQINNAAKAGVAGAFEGKLRIRSRTTGGRSAVVLGESAAADARRSLLGDAPAVALGKPGQPAVLTGHTALNRPADLSRRSVIRLAVDGGEPRDIDGAGERPERTFPAEVVDRINAEFPGLASVDPDRHLVLTAAQQVELVPLRHFTLFEYPPVPTRTPDQAVSHGVRWSVLNDGVGAAPAEWVLASLRGLDRPRLTNRDTGAWVQVDAVAPAGFTIHVRLTDDERLEAWMEAPGRGRRDLTAVLRAQPGPAALQIPSGESRWQYTDCVGDRFDAAHLARRPRGARAATLPVLPGRFAGGPVCHTPATFDQSRFYQPDRPDTENVFGSRTAPAEPTGTSAFAFQQYQAGRFELQLPADLPPQFGGRFNSARFGHAEGTRVIYLEAIFDLPEDPKALDEQVKARPTMVTVGVRLTPDEGVPIYDVPFKEEKPLMGGSPTTVARAYLRQPGVPGVTEVRARDVGTWGNLVVVSAPESATPGAFDVAFRYTGRDVFENARPKVAAQLAFARAAGILAEVTRR